jgi:catechol 2,3-dioxygenase-like lactoylglutathione lyase family enzyme
MNNHFPRMHVSFYVSDIKKSTDFYSKFFGQQPTKVKPAYAKYILEKPSLIISFVENKERVQSNFGHVGFQVETLEQLNEKLAEAKQKNLVAKEEIGTNCCYAKQDKFWVNDPDGVQWEVYYFHADAEFNDPHYESMEASACCTVSSEDIKSSCGCSANVSSTAEKTACC